MEKKMKINDDAFNALFVQARTFNAWQDKEVDDALLHKIYDMGKLGPTAANTNPLRIVFVKSKDQKEMLKPFLDAGNVEKTMAAPVVALFAGDRKFYDHLPKLFPHADARSWYAGREAVIEDTMNRNSTLQAAYFMIAARAFGVDCGPMSGFNKAKVKEAFFKDQDVEVNFICNLGYGDPSKLHPRLPRFDFDEVCKIV